jgi:iron complex transport system substrate-binding protein
MRKLLRGIVSIALLATLLAGCASSPAGNSTQQPQQSTEQKAEESLWPRTYVDALGREVVLEHKPEKPALIFFRNFDQMFVLEEPPVAASDVTDVLKGWESLAPFASKYDIVDLGEMNTANIEKLLEVDPDLIIVYSGVYEKVGDQLDKIAPTIAVSNYGDDWKTPMKEYGKIFGKEDKAEAEIQRLEGLLKEKSGSLASYSDKTFAFITIRSPKEFTVYVIEYVYSKEAGLGLNAPAGYLEKSRQVVSLEGLAEFDPDYLFLYDNALNTVDEGFVAELEKNSVWNSLKSVKNGNVHLLDRSAFSGGPVAIEYGVDAIIKALNS